jgi:uncharacterized protein (TIGR00369 family)
MADHEDEMISRIASKEAEMSNDQHYRALEKMYASAPCNQYYTPTIHISHGTAELSIPIQEQFFHAAGATHGSVYFKALDDVAFFAVNSLVPTVIVLTVSFTIHILRPISEGEMRARGRAVFTSQHLFVAESTLVNSQGREIARGSGNFIKSRIKLSPEIGYTL